MRFKVPGQSVSVRLFERVETVDSQYDIFDVGVEQEDGSIDSIVIGGSFSYAQRLLVKQMKLMRLARLRRLLIVAVAA